MSDQCVSCSKIEGSREGERTPVLCPKCVLARKIGEAVLKMKTGDEIRLRLYSDGYQVTNMPNAGKPVSGHGDTALEALESAGLTKGEKA